MKPVVGVVVSNKMQKSVVVAVDRLFHHKVYNRYVKRTSKFMAHDETDECNIGDRVSNPRAMIPSNLPPSAPIFSFCTLCSYSIQIVSLIAGFRLSSGMMDHPTSLSGISEISVC